MVDLRARLPGRGAWVHPTRACVEAVATRRGLLSRALKQEVDATALLERVREAIGRAVGDGLSQAQAGGALVGGHDVLEDALSHGRVADVVVASDASERTIDSLRRAAGEQVPFTPSDLDREALGKRVGRGPLAAVGVLPSAASTHLRRQLRRSRDLG